MIMDLYELLRTESDEARGFRTKKLQTCCGKSIIEKRQTGCIYHIEFDSADYNIAVKSLSEKISASDKKFNTRMDQR